MERKIITKSIGNVIVAKADCWNTNSLQLRLFSESGCDEGAFYPATDINIYGKIQVEALRDFCVEALKLLEETK